MDTKQKIYHDLEPHFIYDYIFFSAFLRVVQSRENGYKQYGMDKKAKALCLVNLFETYQKSVEDLAAVTLALYRRYNITPACSYQKKFRTDKTPLIYTLIHYKPGEASLKNILSKFSTNSKIINGVGISNVNKSNITLLYSDINLKKTEAFFLESLRGLAQDQSKRLKMFNKIKHCGLIVENGSLLSSTSPNSPAAIYAQPDAFHVDDHPLILHSFKYTEEEFELMSAGIMKVATMMRILLSAYLCVEHYDFVLSKKELGGPLNIFEKIEMKKLLKLWGGY